MQAVKRATETFRYVPKGDRSKPPEEQTTITLRPMTLVEEAAYTDAQEAHLINPTTNERYARRRDFTAAIEVCLAHIEAVENFPAGANGSARPWPKDGSLADKREYLNEFDVIMCWEIAQEVAARTVLPADAGN
jgi:hypothetical protein